MTTRLLWLFVSLFLITLPIAPARAQSSGAGAEPCAALAQADFTTIEDAPTEVAAAAQVAAAEGRPAYCRVTGSIDRTIRFEMRLPARWNGKFLEVGCDGWCGILPIKACDPYLAEGFACIVSDTGHAGSPVDVRWSRDNLQAQINFGYRAVHLAAVAGKAITHHHYSSPASRSYFFGCSTGGYQGVMEAQRFPWDFDGIVAGAPDIDQSQANFRALWLARIRQPLTGQPLLGTAEFTLLHDAVLAACDLDDGVRDGIVGNPRGCKFSPRSLLCKAGQRTGCLSTDQLKAVGMIYSGPTTSAGVPTSTGSFLPGSELGWAITWPTDSLEDYFRYGLAGYSADALWTRKDFDFERDYRRLGLAAWYDNSNPDLRRLKAAGAKLIIYQGATDTIDPPVPVIDYYETVERTMGGAARTRDFFRLFLVPGMNHCGGGAGAMAVDWLGAMEDWVEAGHAPDRVIGTHKGTGDQPGFTRPIYAFPQFARYIGRGDPNAARNFAPAAAR